MMNRSYRNFSVPLFTAFITAFFFCGFVCDAQTDSLQPASTIARDSTKPRKKLSLKPAGDYDQRFSFIDDQAVSIWGYRLGVTVNGKYKVGIGGYFLKQELSGIKRDNNGIPINQLTKNVYYGTIYYEPYLLRRKRWEMSMVFELGYGTAFFDSTNKIRGRFLTKEETQHFVPAGIGLSANLIMPDIKHLHFLTYLGLNGMIGIRKTVFETDLKYNFDGWYWSIGGAVFLDKVFTDLKRRKKPKDVFAN